ncbi:hypothetical protein ACIP9H_33950 [Streptomyces sp. NPDC088732]|uniref:hypothetical protein n=1 Tax=Streptomyces sp. NPDC088732 TaxID=3365879 RepID=UPI0038028349
MDHRKECPLYPVHWLRHAVAAAGRATQDPPEPFADKVSAEALVDALAHFAELSDWESVTLKDIAVHATLMDTPTNRERFAAQCRCRKEE